ncbi:hypothetical protein [Roseimaritima ulvae]|uniref:Uncharacterized protein n=1 Tax=Roseimaritima ulvae TaxID=980254 RepID=A0A5B9R0J9_9BACT|nr:hypothetical protein [Roseimaritima ulvae]QEG43750.1 hypothetical protein UC8_58040 [Roseimaritima ulvae]
MSAAEQQLSDLFEADVDAEILDEQTQGDLQLTVCNINYRPYQSNDSGTGRSPRVQQTVVLMRADAFDFPQFRLAGTSGRGPSRFIMTKLLGATGLRFPDVPEFGKHYMLFGMPEAALRVIFSPSVRQYFAAHPGWSVRGNQQQLAIYRERHLIGDAELDDFVADTTQILTQLSRAEQELDERPEVNRRAGVNDLANMRSQYGSLVGGAIERQLQKFVVERKDLESFLASPMPRVPPLKLKRQVLGDNFPLVIVGIVFMFVGLISGVLWLAAGDGKVRLLGFVPLLLFPLIGLTMTTLTLRYRKRRMRLLREGRLVTGQVRDVQRTNTTVNNRVLHKVTLGLNDRTGERTAQCTVDGMAAKKAKELINNETPVRILVDPQDERNVYCVDLVVVSEDKNAITKS